MLFLPLAQGLSIGAPQPPDWLFWQTSFVFLWEYYRNQRDLIKKKPSMILYYLGRYTVLLQVFNQIIDKVTLNMFLEIISVISLNLWLKAFQKMVIEPTSV